MQFRVTIGSSELEVISSDEVHAVVEAYDLLLELEEWQEDEDEE